MTTESEECPHCGYNKKHSVTITSIRTELDENNKLVKNSEDKSKKVLYFICGRCKKIWDV